MAERRELEVGERVRTRVDDPQGHCRLPRYLRGHEGTVMALHGAARLPDAVAAGRQTEPEPVYAVRFDARDVWGSGTHTITIELWPSYLES